MADIKIQVRISFSNYARSGARQIRDGDTTAWITIAYNGRRLKSLQVGGA